MSEAKLRKPVLTKEQKLAKRRDQYAEKRKVELADQYFERVRYGGNRIVFQDFGKFSRWTWADRTGEWLNEAACKLLIETERVARLAVTGNEQVFGRP